MPKVAIPFATGLMLAKELGAEPESVKEFALGSAMEPALESMLESMLESALESALE